MKSAIILGIGEGHELCPFDKETWVIAKSLMMEGTSEKRTPPKRVDRIFSMDKTDDMLSFKKDSGFYAGYDLEKFCQVMNDTGKPFVTSYTIPELKYAEAFPFKEIVERYGVMYFTNTICYMIAYAMHAGYEEIALWGVNQAGKTEYLKERRGVEFWLGLAAGTGVRVSVNGPSPLLHNHQVYGYKKTEEELAKEFSIGEVEQLQESLDK